LRNSFRIRREFEIDRKAALGVEALGLRRKHRQILYARKYDDGELGVFGARIRDDRKCKAAASAAASTRFIMVSSRDDVFVV